MANYLPILPFHPNTGSKFNSVLRLGCQRQTLPFAKKKTQKDCKMHNSHWSIAKTDSRWSGIVRWLCLTTLIFRKELALVGPGEEDPPGPLSSSATAKIGIWKHDPKEDM